MQYLLTQEEYNDLNKKADAGQNNRAQGVALKMMRHALTDGLCVHTAGRNYCDECPIHKIERNLSSSDLSNQVKSHLCDQPREYSR